VETLYNVAPKKRASRPDKWGESSSWSLEAGEVTGRDLENGVLFRCVSISVPAGMTRAARGGSHSEAWP